MNISDEVINKAVSGIVSFYNAAQQSETEHYRAVLQNRYTDQLLGIKLLVRHDPEKLAFVESAIKSVVNNTPFQSGDACRHPVQSPDVVGQGGTQ